MNTATVSKPKPKTGAKRAARSAKGSPKAVLRFGALPELPDFVLKLDADKQIEWFLAESGWRPPADFIQAGGLTSQAERSRVRVMLVQAEQAGALLEQWNTSGASYFRRLRFEPRDLVDRACAQYFQHNPEDRHQRSRFRKLFALKGLLLEHKIDFDLSTIATLEVANRIADYVAKVDWTDSADRALFATALADAALTKVHRTIRLEDGSAHQTPVYTINGWLNLHGRGGRGGSSPTPDAIVKRFVKTTIARFDEVAALRSKDSTGAWTPIGFVGLGEILVALEATLADTRATLAIASVQGVSVNTGRLRADSKRGPRSSKRGPVVGASR